MKNILKISALFATAFLLSFSFASFASADTANPGSTPTFTSVGFGTVNWSTPSNAGAQDGQYAAANLDSSNPISDFLTAKSFGFNIPTGSTIDGIQLSIRRSSSQNARINDSRVRILKNSSPTSQNAATSTAWSSTDTTVVYGSPTDKWGTSWTASDINSSNFGAELLAIRNGGNPTAQVDFMTITVFYTPVTPVITLSANHSTSTPTNQNITVTASASVGTLNATSTTFTANGSFSFIATNGSKSATSTVVINNINKVAPVVNTRLDISLEATGPTGAIATFIKPTATDDLDGTTTVSCSPASGSTFALGTTTDTCSSTDTAGNVGTSTFKVVVVDTTAPILTVNGSSTLTIEGGSTYADAGATATDTVDTAINSKVTASSSVNVHAVGTYSVVYNVTDASGNKATSTSRTVIVKDTTAPVISSHSDLTFEAVSASGATAVYTNPTAMDAVEGNLATVCTPTSGTTLALGTTTINCSVTDSSSNTATSSFKVFVVDTTAPVVHATLGNLILVPIHTPYTEYGATATDLVDGTVTASTTDIVPSTDSLATYFITYTAVDAHGNVGSTTRTVKIVDVTAPTVAVNPDINLEATGPTGAVATFTLPTATDDVDASSTVSASVFCSPASGSVFALGTSTVKCSATDLSGNVGTSTFKVMVVDTTAPLLSLNGSSTMTVEAGSTFVDPGATATDTVDTTVNSHVVASSSVNMLAVGTYGIDYNVTDASGNKATSTSRVVIVVDTTAPVIHLNGSSTVSVEGATTYTDLGATVTDNVSLPATLTSTSTVNTHVVGTYAVTYDAYDASGNHATTTVRTVNVIDTTAPVIHINGQNPIVFTIGNPYYEYNATAADTVDGVRPVTISGTVDTNTLGSYTVSYSATDLSGNSATSTRTVVVVVPDTTAPVITVLGSNPATVEAGSTYIDAGATSLDNVSGDLTAHIVSTSTVGSNPRTVGIYGVHYSSTDGAGNTGTADRVVNVVDHTKPVITLNGAGTMSIEVGTTTFTDPGAVVTDNTDEVITPTVDGSVDTLHVGSNVLVYNAVDSSGNHADPVSRTVNVVDTDVPIISLNGSGTVAVEVHSVYEDAGATAYDDVDGALTPIMSGTVNTDVIGDYTLYYNVTDAEGKDAAVVTRLVRVRDTTAPVVTLNGSSTVSIIVGGTYTELGATVSDNYDEGLTATTTGTVDASSTGTYIITYSATDSSLNTGTTTRTVIVNPAPDTQAPVITLFGSNPTTVTVNGTYTEAGATTTDNVDASVPVVITGSVDTHTLGTYTLTYTATDSSENTATTTRIVNVVPVSNTGEGVGNPPSSGGNGGGGGGASGGGNIGDTTTTGSRATTTPNTGGGTGNGTSTGQVLGIHTFKFNKNLRIGMRNTDVTELQKRLIEEGFFTGDTTGYFGPKTFASVKLYQSAHHVKPVSGFVGPLTRTELNK